MAADAAIHDFPNRNKGVDAGFAGMTVEAPLTQESMSMPTGMSDSCICRAVAIHHEVTMHTKGFGPGSTSPEA